MTTDMRKNLEDWLAKNFCPLIETTGTLVYTYRFCLNNKKRTISISFTRYHHEKDPWEYIILNRGFVLTVPSLWLGIPKELVIPYLEYYIDGYLDSYVYNDNPDEDDDDGNTKPICPVIPPCHPIPPRPPHNGTKPPPPPPIKDFEGELLNINSSCPAGGCANGDCESKVTGV